MKIKITGVHRNYDGEYDFDPDKWTSRDWHTLKKLADVLPAELADELRQGNQGVVVSIAVIETRRAGKPEFADAFWDAKPGWFAFVDDEEEEARPPVSQPTSGPESPPAEPDTSSEPREPTGATSPSDGDGPQESRLRAIGGPI